MASNPEHFIINRSELTCMFEYLFCSFFSPFTTFILSYPSILFILSPLLPLLWLLWLSTFIHPSLFLYGTPLLKHYLSGILRSLRTRPLCVCLR